MSVSYLRPSFDREPAYCQEHQKHFVRYGFNESIPSNGSWGCPDCVEPIRDDVQRLIHPVKELHWLDRLKGRKIAA